MEAMKSVAVNIGAEGFSKDCQKLQAVAIVFKDGFALVSSVGDVVERTGVLDAKWSNHASFLALAKQTVKDKDLTPFFPRLRYRSG